MKVPPVGARLFHVDGRTDRQTDGPDEPNSRFSQFFANAPKKGRDSVVSRVTGLGASLGVLIPVWAKD
jgi:hypothetical protein